MAREDEIAIKELLHMAKSYLEHGLPDKADEILDLVDRMERRLERENSIVALHDWQDKSRRPA